MLCMEAAGESLNVQYSSVRMTPENIKNLVLKIPHCKKELDVELEKNSYCHLVFIKRLITCHNTVINT